MPELFNDRNIFSLLEVAQSIRRTLAERYSSSFWVKAEMNRLNLYPHSGHCYPDLVEKAGGKIVAEMRATIWKDDFDRINSKFRQVVHEPLKDGIGILFQARVSFHPAYGLSLQITDIDPSFSLGELEREKQETIDKLKKEGIFTLNKTREMPLLPKRIAVISVDTSKGFADFVKVIRDNPWGYSVFYMLFPALLQGEKAVESILGQLSAIGKVRSHFDAVAIIRGGGGDIGLTCYNNHALARAIALFPIPVITGIGHSTNETVAEMTAYRNSITPTELADFLIQQFHNYSVPLGRAMEKIRDFARSLPAGENRRLAEAVRRFRTSVRTETATHSADLRHCALSLASNATGFTRLLHERHVISSMRSLSAATKNRLGISVNSLSLAGVSLVQGVRRCFAKELQQISQYEKMVEIMDPVHVLKRGYTITLVDGKAITSAGQACVNNQIRTLLPDGIIHSSVTSITKNSEE